MYISGNFVFNIVLERWTSQYTMMYLVVQYRHTLNLKEQMKTKSYLLHLLSNNTLSIFFTITTQRIYLRFSPLVPYWKSEIIHYTMMHFTSVIAPHYRLERTHENNLAFYFIFSLTVFSLFFLYHHNSMNICDIFAFNTVLKNYNTQCNNLFY